MQIVNEIIACREKNNGVGSGGSTKRDNPSTKQICNVLDDMNKKICDMQKQVALIPEVMKQVALIPDVMKCVQVSTLSPSSFPSRFDKMVLAQFLLPLQDILNRLEKKDANQTRDEANSKQEDDHTVSNPDLNVFSNSGAHDDYQPTAARKSDSTSDTTSGSSAAARVETVVHTVAHGVRKSKRNRKTPMKLKSPMMLEKNHPRHAKKDHPEVSKRPKDQSWSGNFHSYLFFFGVTLTDSRGR
jgi:hypothetical protein